MISRTALASALVLVSGLAYAQDLNAMREQCTVQDFDMRIANCSALIESGLETDPAERAFEYGNRARAYHGKDDFERAVADYNRALAIVKTADNFQMRGRAKTSLGNLDGAIADYNEALKLDPRNVGMLLDRGNALNAARQLDLAIADFNRALSIDPDNPDVLNDRGMSYSFKGDHDRAIMEFSRVIQLDPSDPAAYVNRGSDYLNLGDFPRAIADFDAALQRDNQRQSAFFNRGAALYLTGEFAQSATDLSRAVELKPDDWGAVLWLHFARGKARQDDRPELTRNAKPLSDNPWRASLVKLHLGEITLSDLQRVANAERDPVLRPIHQCQAAFNGGEYVLLNSNPAAAKPLFQQAMTVCEKTTIDYLTAAAELKWLP
jgi:lipoprotein NlpI